MMTHAGIFDELKGKMAELPMLDAHTHLVGGKLGARGLHDILLYHMPVSDLYGHIQRDKRHKDVVLLQRY